MGTSLKISAGPLGPPGCEELPWDIVLPSWWFKPQDWWMVSIWMLFSCPLEQARYHHRCTLPQEQARYHHRCTLPQLRCPSWQQSCPLEQARYHHRCTLPQLRRPSGHPWKSINFQASLQGNKCHENWSQGHPESWKIEPEIIRNPISAKVVFFNTFHAKCLFLQSRTPEFRPKNHQKKHPGNRYEQILFLSHQKSKKLLKSFP